MGPLEHPAYERLSELVGESETLTSVLLDTRERLKEVFQIQAELLDACHQLITGRDTGDAFEESLGWKNIRAAIAKAKP